MKWANKEQCVTDLKKKFNCPDEHEKSLTIIMYEEDGTVYREKDRTIACLACKDIYYAKEMADESGMDKLPQQTQ